jgi:diguanylate cyclase (GGDEF)-like protein
MNRFNDVILKTADVRLASRPKLLLVDDQPLNIRLLHEIFQSDHEIFVATSGTDALAFCTTQLPDLILLDVIMPHMDGHEVCRRLKQGEATRDIPVIFITSHSDGPEEELGLEAGAVDFISKSASARVIRARVRSQLTLKYQADLLRSLTRIDSMTGVANRRHFDETLEAEWRRCARDVKPLSLLMIDIDFFKRYNDRYGHQAGDDCLQQVAQCLQEGLTRSHDLLARYGGEEFVCILPDTPLEGGQAKAKDLLNAIRKLAMAHESSEIENGIVTASIGLASVTPDHQHTMKDLISAADSMLYQAKQQGRARICAMQI